MPVTTELTTETTDVQRIVATRPSQKVSRKEVKEILADLSRRGRITNRDEKLLEMLREFNVLSLNQIQRLLWPAAQEMTAYRRLHFLEKHHLLGIARSPHAEMRQWGLLPRKVYTLDLGGWLWLKLEVDSRLSHRHLRREQVLHDVLVAEVYVRVVEAVSLRSQNKESGESWAITWVGEEAAGFYQGDNPVISPDGLVVVKRIEAARTQVLPFFVEFDKGREAHGKPSSDWGRKVGGYNRFAGGGSNWQMHPQLSDLPDKFPRVLVITHGKNRLLNLGRSITKHRKEPVVYYLALWNDVIQYDDFLTAPVWLVITEEGKVIGKDPARRRSLLPPSVNVNTPTNGQVSANGSEQTNSRVDEAISTGNPAPEEETLEAHLPAVISEP